MKVVFTGLSRDEWNFYSSNLKNVELFLFEETIDELDMGDIYDADILSVFVFDKLDRETLEHFTELKLIHTRSVGYDHIDVNYCREKGVLLTHVPDYSPSAVAQHALALILSLVRFLPRFKARTQTMNFGRDKSVLGSNIEDLTVGIIGTGKIGSLVARYMVSLGAKVLAHDLCESEELKKMGVIYVPIQQLLSESDVISLHVPYTRETHHLIDEKAIKLMRNDVVLVNTSRGGVIDTEALYRAYKEGKFSGLGLDVFEEEEVLILKRYSNRTGSHLSLKLLELNVHDNVLITPHIAFYTKRALENIRNSTLSVIKSFISGDIDSLSPFVVNRGS